MKRFLVLLTSVMMLCSITAFAEETDAKAVYDEMLAKTSAMTDLNAFYDMNIKMTDGTDTESIRIEMNTKINNIKEPEKMQYMAYIRANMDDTDLTMAQYYKDGYCYMASMGRKMKYPIDFGQMVQQAMNSSLANTTITSGYMKDLKVRTEGSDRILSYTIDEEMLNSLVKQVLASMGMEDFTNGLTMKIYDISGEYVVNPEGYYTKAKLNMKMNVSTQGVSLELQMDADIGIADPGQPVVIDMPDFSEYEEVEAM